MLIKTVSFYYVYTVAMELCEAGCVQSLLEKEKKLPETCIAPITKSILSGIYLFFFTLLFYVCDF